MPPCCDKFEPGLSSIFFVMSKAHYVSNDGLVVGRVGKPKVGNRFAPFF